jgi:tellurite methyltransferase
MSDTGDDPTGAGPDDARARWNARHRARIVAATDPSEPAGFLTDRAQLLPQAGRALDVAGGTGRNALWLAGRGLDVTLVDVSDAACAEATARAVATGVPLDVVRADLTVDPIPAGPWDVIVVHHFLDRDLWRRLPGHLAAGGLLLAAQPTVSNLERHARPVRRWLLDDGEVVALADDLRADDPGLEVLEATEGWTAEGRHEAHLVLRRRD